MKLAMILFRVFTATVTADVFFAGEGGVADPKIMNHSVPCGGNWERGVLISDKPKIQNYQYHSLQFHRLPIGREGSMILKL